ncbi:MAG TPA: heparinase II/III family protein [Candidatus Hydrogenedentes bacterium]|nr:heparinase II/III family protein [Candidatus Hydrogenedentota bacterium]HPG70220.1 heparinase II/III family protein [Candidatus Hydrogenedentota bacterium]
MANLKSGSGVSLSAALVVILNLACPTSGAVEGVSKRMAEANSDHPRLFATDAEWPALKDKVLGDPALKACNDYVIACADDMMALDLLKREKVGKRLLGVSRTCLRRVSYLAYAYRMTGSEVYLKRAERDMLAVTAFEDWNPSHFLDVGEMTAALAIGYDWLYAALSPESRDAIRTAIADKGLKASFGKHGWIKADNNWNPVCHGGMVLGALATLESDPDLSQQVVARAMENVPIAMREYAPDGVYPEGPGYWLYGTTFNVLLIDALESALGSSFGLADLEGFDRTPGYYLHSAGPSGLFFNFSDSGSRSDASPAMHWFATRTGDPGLLWREKGLLDSLAEQTPEGDGSASRLLPFLLVWGQPLGKLEPPQTLHWKGAGRTPIALHRTAWTDDATFVGIKGGSPHTNHAHMDIGSFVLEMDGVRWGIDLGAQGYDSLESKGVDLWNRAQDSERWTVFRLNNFSHNTLVVNGALQRVDANAPITAFSDNSETPFTIVDMATAYQGELDAAMRGVRLYGESVLIQDEIAAPDRPTHVRWGMVTNATVSMDGSHATLEQDSKTVSLELLAPDGVAFKIYDTETPPRDYDAANPNTRMIGFETDLDPKASQTLRVYIHSGAAVEPGPGSVPLLDW